MVGGLTQVKEDWGTFPKNLALDRPVLVFDNRGIGESYIPRSASEHLAYGPYTMEQMAEDVLCLASHLGWNRFHLLGISMGGMIAQRTAILGPTRIDKLVLLCTTADGTPERGNEFLQNLLSITGDNLPDKQEALHRMMVCLYNEEWIASNPEHFEQILKEYPRHQRGSRAIMAQMRGIAEHHITEDELRSITQPTLMIHGVDDAVLSVRKGQHIAQYIPDITFHELPATGHQLIDIAEKYLFERISAFLNNGRRQVQRSISRL
ncbi:hypothetical protein CYMTET_43110 [Cymbomonas tetramitiformis]|uniref:AB hydrolase-1 domain-containing protein n=1 Tax=Cymbomonas tetramitiformis TaxID=36881 RepID=A0AAE0F0Z1_9CHLO|nr:hypothetical protein CYMTET_43110 [Cymbomonas tetramitiformis]